MHPTGTVYSLAGYSHKYVIGFIDAFIYAFLPWWTTVLLRLIQRRTWHHRVAGRLHSDR